MQSAQVLCKEMDVKGAVLWEGDKPPQLASGSRSIVLVASCARVDQKLRSDVEAWLPRIASELPYRGRVWLVVSASGEEWECLGRQWAAQYPSLMMSVLRVNEFVNATKALFDLDAPPHTKAS